MAGDWYNPKQFRRSNQGEFNPAGSTPAPSTILSALFWMLMLGGLTLLALAYTSRPTLNGASLQLNADRSGHFQISGSIRQQPVNFLIDTGATTITLPESMRTTLGVNCERAVQSHTANGIARGCSAVLEAIDVGAYRLPGIEVMFLPNLNNALLGMNAISRFRMSQQSGWLSLTPLPGANVSMAGQPQSVNRGYLTAGLMALIACGVLGFKMARKSVRPQRIVTVVTPSVDPDPLLTACRGDRQLMNRLIDYELRRAPGLMAKEIKKRALERLSRDRS